MELSEVQLLMLNNLVYLEKFTEESAEGKTIGQILDSLNEEDFNSAGGATSITEWKQIAAHAINDQQLKSLYIYRVQTDERGAKILCVSDCAPNQVTESSQAVVVFSGTGQNEWRDDAVAGAQISTEQQERALEFVNELPMEKVLVTGHSKGGNKAMFVAVLSDKVTECYSFDGEGFSDEFIEAYQKQIEERRDRIHQRCHSRDYVNILLKPVYGDVIYYTNQEGTSPDDEIGLGGYHCADMMFRHDEDGNILYEMSEGSSEAQDDSMKLLHQFIVYFMDHAPRGEKIVALSVLGELLQKFVSEGEINPEIIEKYMVNGTEILFRYMMAFLEEYKQTNPEEFQVQMQALALLMEEYFGETGLKISKIVYLLIETGSLFELYEWFSAAFHIVGGGTLIRDFTQDTKMRLIEMAKETEEEEWWQITRWDCWYRLEQLFGQLKIEEYASDINQYYRKLVDINGAGYQEIIRIFDEVYALDQGCGKTVEDSLLQLKECTNCLRILTKGMKI